MTLTFLQALGGLLLLFVGGDLLVRGSSGLAFRFGLSPLAVGLTVVSFGTSAPELLVSLDAAIAGANGLSVGNVVGSNIANIALILGIAALLRPLMVESKVLGVDVPIMMLATGLMLIVLAGGFVSRLEGTILALCLAGYVWVTLHMARESRDQGPVAAEAGSATVAGAPKLILLIVSGLAVMFGGAHILVLAAVELATLLKVSEAAIGLTIVAVGTSLPELSATTVACLKREGDIAIGNVVGSNTFNILGVLGITSVVHPLKPGNVGWPDLALMSALAVFLGALLLHRLYLHRVHGVILALIFVVYTGWRLTGS